jgi:hypothetical protein
MKSTTVAAAFLWFLVMSIGACRGCDAHLPPPRPPPADSGAAPSEPGAHLDPGPRTANDVPVLGCCFTTTGVILCPVGVVPPDAGAMMMRACRGGK